MTLQQLILFACPESLTTTRRSHFPCCRYFADMQLILFACLLATTRARRHLCDDLTLPNCANGDKADYNPTGENRCHKRKWKCLVALVPVSYICWYNDQASPLYWWLHSNMLWRLWPNCEQKHLKKIPLKLYLLYIILFISLLDVNYQVRNNICAREEKQCPQGQGKAVCVSFFHQFLDQQTIMYDLWLSINSIKLLLRALLSLGTYVRMVPSPVVPMEIETHVLSTSENALTGRLLFLLSFGNRGTSP